MEALLDHYAGIPGGLFCSLTAGRVNHSYEKHDWVADSDWREEWSHRQTSWACGTSKSLTFQQELG